MMLWSPRSAGTGDGDGEGDSESFTSRGPTQVEDDFLESYEEKTLMGEASQLSQQEASSNSNGKAATKERPPEPWGRLLPLKRGAAHIKLFPRPAETSNGQANTYIFGRGHSCDIRLEDARISSQHCRIYCLENREPGGRITFKVYVEDTSSNGTFVNRRVRLAKSQRRLLNSGDELCLVKARDDQDYEAASYVFIPMESHQPQARRPLNSDVGGTAFASSVATAAAPATGGGMSSFQPSSSSSSSSSTAAAAVTLRGQTSAGGAGAGGRKFGLFGGNGARRIEDFYDIREEIGRGTCGRVHVALHRKTGESWAVKVIETRKFGLTPGLSPKELVQEAEVLRTIAHPHVVRLQDIFQTEDVLYLVMELVRGGDLFDRIIDRGRYTETAARELMRHVLQAVQYLHARDIVHRDLKPENILLVHKESDVDVKLTDFGLAKRTTSEGLKTFCGTPQYFAPEVLKRRNTTLGTGRYGREADMWSLGVILYIALSGTPPFDDTSLFEQIRTAKYTFEGPEWEGVSGQAKDLVRKLMTASPSTRLKVDQALRHPWFTVTSTSSSSSSSDEIQGTSSGTAIKAIEAGGHCSSATDVEEEETMGAAVREEGEGGAGKGGENKTRKAESVVAAGAIKAKTRGKKVSSTKGSTTTTTTRRKRKTGNQENQTSSSSFQLQQYTQQQPAPKDTAGSAGEGAIPPPLVLQSAAAVRQAMMKQPQQHQQQQQQQQQQQPSSSKVNPTSNRMSPPAARGGTTGNEKKGEGGGAEGGGGGGGGGGGIKRRRAGKNTFEVGVTAVELPDDNIDEYSSGEEGGGGRRRKTGVGSKEESQCVAATPAAPAAATPAAPAAATPAASGAAAPGATAAAAVEPATATAPVTPAAAAAALPVSAAAAALPVSAAAVAAAAAAATVSGPVVVFPPAPRIVQAKPVAAAKRKVSSSGAAEAAAAAAAAAATATSKETARPTAPPLRHTPPQAQPQISAATSVSPSSSSSSTLLAVDSVTPPSPDGTITASSAPFSSSSSFSSSSFSSSARSNAATPVPNQQQQQPPPLPSQPTSKTKWQQQQQQKQPQRQQGGTTREKKSKQTTLLQFLFMDGGGGSRVVKNA